MHPAHFKQNFTISVSAGKALKWSNNTRALSTLSPSCLQQKSYLHFFYGLLSNWNSGMENWILLCSDDIFFLYLNFWWSKVLRKTHTNFSNENWALHWHPGKGMGRAASSAVYQKYYPSFQPAKWKKWFLCSGAFLPIISGSIHFSMFFYTDRTCWSLTCTIWEPRVAFWLFNNINNQTLQSKMSCMEASSSLFLFSFKVSGMSALGTTKHNQTYSVANSH